MSHSIMEKKYSSYVDSIDAMELDSDEDKDRKLNASEQSSFRSIC